MADPLSILREYVKDKKDIFYDNEELHFGKTRFSKDVKTAFRGMKGKGEFYTLGALYFCWKLDKLNVTEYRQECKTAGVSIVSLVDKRDVLSYLTGETDSCASIAALPDLLPGSSVLSAADLEEPPSKRVRVEAAAEPAEKRASEPADKKAESAAVAQQAPEPSEGMSVEKIAELQAKRAAKKARKPEEGDKKKEAAEADPTAEVLKQERPLCTRYTILQSTRKVFTSVLQLVSEIRKKEAGAKKDGGAAPAPAPPPPPAAMPGARPAPGVPLVRRDRYNVDDQQFWKNRLEGHEQIDLDYAGSFMARAAAKPGADSGAGPAPDAAAAAAAAAPAPAPSTSAAAAAGSSRAPPAPGRDRQGAPGAPRTSSSSSSGRPGAPAPGSSSRSAPPTGSSSRPGGAAGSRPPGAKRVHPIIVVPAGMTALINMYNAKDFLADGRFVTVEEKRNEAKGLLKKEPRVAVARPAAAPLSSSGGSQAPASSPRGHGTIEYHIVDSVDRFKSEDWERVVAVFTAGQQWQFNDWPMKNPPDIFAAVRGFYVMYDDDKPNEQIQKWHVEILKISRNKRYLDKPAMRRFWEVLEDFALHKKPWLVS